MNPELKSLRAKARKARDTRKAATEALAIAKANLSRARGLVSIQRQELTEHEAERARRIDVASDELFACIQAGDEARCGMSIDIDAEIVKGKTLLAIAEGGERKAADAYDEELKAHEAAEDAWTDVLLQLTYAKLEQYADEFEAAVERIYPMADRLRAAAGRGLDIPVDRGKRIFSERILSVLQRMPERDGIHTSVAELRGNVVRPDYMAQMREEIMNELLEPAA